MTRQEIINAAHQRATWNGERWGQAVFNAASKMNPRLAEELIGTDLDPYYDSDRAEAFIAAMVSRSPC